MYRILDEHIQSHTVHIKIRYTDFTTVSAQQSGAVINDSSDLYERAQQLFFSHFDDTQSVRLIGIGVDVGSGSSQLDLFASEKDAKKRKLEEAVLNITKNNSSIKIIQARLLPPQDR